MAHTSTPPSPDDIENAQRRNYFRAETTGDPLPSIDLWPLIDVGSCIASERHNEQVHLGQLPRGRASTPSEPRVGEHFRGVLADASGGGMRVLLPPSAESLLRLLPVLWVKADLPERNGPLCFAARIAHHHTAPDNTLVIGLSFTFDHNPRHERFVTDQMCRFAAYLQRRQLQRKR